MNALAPKDRDSEIIQAINALRVRMDVMESTFASSIEGCRQQMSVLTQEMNMREIRQELFRMRAVLEYLMKKHVQ